MPLISVTQELIHTIKSLRKAEKKRGDELSRELKKNTSFISQLENGKINELDIDIFYNIFEKIIPDDKRRMDIINELLQTQTIKYTPKEMLKQSWMVTFDYQYRQQIIPNEIVDFIKMHVNLLQEKGINTSDIMHRLNLNEELSEPNKYEDNKVYVKHDETEGWVSQIKFNLPENIISEIVDKKLVKINYITLLGIVYNIYKIEGYDNSKEMARNLLFDNKFYTLIQKRSIMKNKKFEEMLNSEDKEFMELYDTLSNHLKFLGDKDADYINSKLRILCSNLKEEPSLTLAIIGIELANLDKLDIFQKKQFISDFKELIQKYQNITEIKSIEILD